MAAEYSKLSGELGEDFNPRTAKRVGELSAVTSALREWEDANSVSGDWITLSLASEVLCGHGFH